ncbi:hypothetical protein LY13_004399 [Prauserella aidingensis]|nr:hypothetical protein [Prauserella aidingensis]MCP2255620.1 hypothetical protein [Prauserella aidingensis]
MSTTAVPLRLPGCNRTRRPPAVDAAAADAERLFPDRPATWLLLPAPLRHRGRSSLPRRPARSLRRRRTTNGRVPVFRGDEGAHDSLDLIAGQQHAEELSRLGRFARHAAARFSHRDVRTGREIPDGQHPIVSRHQAHGPQRRRSGVTERWRCNHSRNGRVLAERLEQVRDMGRRIRGDPRDRRQEMKRRMGSQGNHETCRRRPGPERAVQTPRHGGCEGNSGSTVKRVLRPAHSVDAHASAATRRIAIVGIDFRFVEASVRLAHIAPVLVLHRRCAPFVSRPSHSERACRQSRGQRRSGRPVAGKAYTSGRPTVGAGG